MIKNIILPLIIICASAPSIISMEKLRDHLGRSPITLASQRDIETYAAEVVRTSREGTPHDLLRLVDPPPTLAFPPTIPNMEAYTFTRTEALYTAYTKLATEKATDYTLTHEYTLKAIRAVKEYLDSFEETTSDQRSLNEHLVFHKYCACEYYGNALFKLMSLTTSLKNSAQATVEMSVLAKQAITAFQKALKYGHQSLVSAFINETPGLADRLKMRWYNNQFSLLSAYTSLVQCVPLSEASVLLAKARTICQLFESQDQLVFHRRSLTTLDVTEKALELRRRGSMEVKSKAVQERRAQKTSVLAHEVLDLVRGLDSDIGAKSNVHLKEKFVLMLRELNVLMGTHQITDYKAIAEGLKKIENEMRSVLRIKNITPSADDIIPLENVYENLHKLLGGEIVITDFWIYMSPFVLTDDLEGGIERAEILKKIEMNQRVTISHKTRFVAAALKNLKGDYTEWLELEKELAVKEAEKKQKDKEKKARAHQHKVAAIQAIVADRKAVLEEAKEKPPVLEQKAPHRSAPSAISLDQGSPSFLSDDQIDDQKRKLEKLQRHEEAEEKRQQERDEKAEKDSSLTQESATPTLAAPTLPTRPLSREEQRELILQSSSLTLAELYGLSSRPLEVDQEIVNNTWKFTRAEFEAYLTAMGCECKSGKGIHTKAGLPKATLVMHGYEVITILNDFGGSLTLPLWDKDYVPHYLRKQILEACKNLRALKILEMNEKKSLMVKHTLR